MRLLLTLLVFIPLSAQAHTAARIITDVGTIMIELDEQKPQTTNNFVNLATGEAHYTTVDGKKSDKPFYDGLIFHRVNPELGIFSGCPWGTGRGWPGYFIDEESPEGSKFDQPGLVAMAKIKGEKQYGSQFFITSAPAPFLNGKYTIFGTVTAGLDVVMKIANTPRGQRDNPLKPIHIKHIEIVRN
jgi:peptidyl-prolyl cis-trans isomerase A (cyclophilin A)